MDWGFLSFRRWSLVFALLALIGLRKERRKRTIMSARVCRACDVAWPTITWTDQAKKGKPTTFRFDDCPQCRRPTAYRAGVSAISKAEARSLVCHARFKRFYRVWEMAREQRGDLTPEARGRLEAKEIYALEQAYKAEQSAA